MKNVLRFFSFFLIIVFCISVCGVGSVVNAGLIGEEIKTEMPDTPFANDPLSGKALEQLIKQSLGTGGALLRNIKTVNLPLVQYQPGTGGVIGTVNQFMDVAPAINAGGKIIGSGMLVLNAVDTGISTRNLFIKDYSNMTSGQVVVIKTLNLADVGMGIVSTTGGVLILVGAVEASPAIAAGLLTLGVVKGGNTLLMGLHERDPFKTPLR